MTTMIARYVLVKGFPTYYTFECHPLSPSIPARMLFLIRCILTLYCMYIQGSMVCYHTWDGETVPGCNGEDPAPTGHTDFCVEPYTHWLTYRGRDAEDAPEYFPLGVCEGKPMI